MYQSSLIHHILKREYKETALPHAYVIAFLSRLDAILWYISYITISGKTVPGYLIKLQNIKDPDPGSTGSNSGTIYELLKIDLVSGRKIRRCTYSLLHAQRNPKFFPGSKHVEVKYYTFFPEDLLKNLDCYPKITQLL